MIAAAPPVAALLAPCDTVAAARSFTLTVRSGGLDRTARVHVPAKAGRLPVLLVLHFATGTGPQMETPFKYSRLADRKGFIAVYPSSGHSRGFWNVREDPAQADDVQFMRDLLDTLPSQVCSDPHRVYATGVSNGASMTGVLGCRMADRLAAIAPVSGGYTTYGSYPPSRPVTAFAVHGSADRVVPYGGVKRFTKVWRGRNGCNATPTARRTGDLVRYRWRCTARPVSHLKLIGRGHFLNYSRLEAVVWEAVRRSVS